MASQYDNFPSDEWHYGQDEDGWLEYKPSKNFIEPHRPKPGDADFEPKSMMSGMLHQYLTGKKESLVEPDWEDNPVDMVNAPAHYATGNHETIEVIKEKLTKEQFIGYCMGNVSKYVLRCNLKGKFVEDLKKAQYYLNALVEAVDVRR